MTFFLTSTTKRRMALLQQLGFQPDVDFFTASVPIDENRIQPRSRLSSDEAKELVVSIARLKAEIAVERGNLAANSLLENNTAVVGVHTIRLFDELILRRSLAGEPFAASPVQIRQARQDSRRTLLELSGREFSVLTGLVAIQGDNMANSRSAWAETTVKLKAYNATDVDAYIGTGEGLPIPGGIDLHGQGIVLCKGINGSISNVGGLPLAELVALFRDPLFADRIPFHLDEADQSRFSIPVKPGPPQVELVRFSDYAGSQDEFVSNAEITHVLLVPGSLLTGSPERATIAKTLSTARQRGLLVVLDNSVAVEEVFGEEVFQHLLHNQIDLTADGQLEPEQLRKFMYPRLLLASQSPRRCELLKQIVAPNQIEVRISNEDEEYLDELPADHVQRLALAKARAVYQQEGSYSPSIDIVIGADTEVVLEGKALGKPVDADEAREQLSRLSGRSHQVLTGIALISTADGREFADCVSTDVTFKSLTGDEIDTYIASGEPFGKAGSYAIQSKGTLLVSEIRGSYSNVVGLPLERLSEILDREFNLPVWQLDPVSGWRQSLEH